MRIIGTSKIELGPRCKETVVAELMKSMELEEGMSPKISCGASVGRACFKLGAAGGLTCMTRGRT
jgi:hypothetical protein